MKIHLEPYELATIGESFRHWSNFVKDLPEEKRIIILNLCCEGQYSERYTYWLDQYMEYRKNPHFFFLFTQKLGSKTKRFLEEITSAYYLGALRFDFNAICEKITEKLNQEGGVK